MLGVNRFKIQWTLGSDDVDDDGNAKKTIGLIRKTMAAHGLHVRFEMLVHFFVVMLKTLGAVYMRKLAPLRVLYWDEYLNWYRVYTMPT